MRQIQILRMLVCLTLSIFSAVGMIAQNRALERRELKPAQPGGVAQIERVLVLRPSAESEVKRQVFVLELADGARAVASSSEMADRGVRTEARSVEWTVDLNRGTYTAKRVEITEQERELMREARERWAAEDETWKDRRETEAMFVGSGYSYMHKAETWEIAAFFGADPLTRTYAELSWSECGGTLYTDGFLHQCWANASTLGIGFTKWETLSCNPTPSSFSGDSLDGHVIGRYINWDWGWNSDSTRAYQDVNVVAQPGGTGYGWVYQYQDGEDSWLLAGREFQGSVYSRPGRCENRSNPPLGGGGGSGGGSDPAPSLTCVPIYDGVTGERLGTCCGFTVNALISCAARYL